MLQMDDKKNLQLIKEAIKALTDIRDEATEDESSVCYVTSEDAEYIDMAIKALQTKTDGDIISRQDAISLVDRPIVPTGDDVYDNAREDERASIKDDLLSLPSAEPKEKRTLTEDDYHYCEDCNACEVCSWYPYYGCEFKIAGPKTGRWIKAKGMMPPEFHGNHCCSECGNFANMEPPFGNREGLSNYCPNCGAVMVREDGEEKCVTS